MMGEGEKALNDAGVLVREYYLGVAASQRHFAGARPRARPAWAQNCA
jgi:hypothetical protein